MANASNPDILIAVPNFSCGPDAEVLDAISSAFQSANCRVLDVHSDPDHQRSVFTVAGSAEELPRGLVAAAREATTRIDLRQNTGVHPHVGVLDVCPIVFRSPEQLGAACLVALATGAGIGDLGLPVFTYGDLAQGRTRAELRRGGVAGLCERVLSAEQSPAFGPKVIDPAKGTVLLSARKPLLAFNLELEPPATVDEAKRIASLIREGGEHGLVGVRAIGLSLTHEAGLAAGASISQVSCNVEDHLEVPLAHLLEAVGAYAPVATCEVIGLPPEAAFDGFPDSMPVRNRRTLEEALAAES